MRLHVLERLAIERSCTKAHLIRDEALIVGSRVIEVDPKDATSLG
jgi:hypothetical protein